MNNKIIIINGPNLNLLGEREQSQYGSGNYEQLKESCLKKSKEIGLDCEFIQSNLEGDLVNTIQDARKTYDGMIINAAAFTHTSVAIRDALELFKKPIIEMHISNIYKREEFRHKSLPPPSGFRPRAAGAAPDQPRCAVSVSCRPFVPPHLAA